MSKLPSITNNNLNQIFFALLPDHHSGQNLGSKEKLSEIQDLLRYGVDVNGEVQPGVTPLSKAIKDGGSKILVELLIHFGALLNNSSSGFEWTDTDGKIIRNQVYALAKQRFIRCQDKESQEIVQLIQKQLIQEHLQQSGFENEASVSGAGVAGAASANGASMSRVTNCATNGASMNRTTNGSTNGVSTSVSANFHSNSVSTNGVSGNGVSATNISANGHTNNGFAGLSYNTFNHSFSNAFNTASNNISTNGSNHGNVAPLPLPLHGIMIKKKIFVFEFDNSLVNEHFHRILKKMGVAPGHASPDLVEFLFLKYGIKNKEILYSVFKDILDNEDCICIASNSRYPETIYTMINNLGLSESEKQQILYMPPDLNTTEDLTIGKNLDILRAMLHFHIIDINAVYLIDQDRTNLQIARVKLNIPDSNLVKVDSDPNPAPNHLHYIQGILKKSRVTKPATSNNMQAASSGNKLQVASSS